MKRLVTIILFLFASQAVFSADGSSGCGLGWQVFKKNSLISSALRASTNATFLNTLGMTFGTSGCAQHSIVKNEKKSLHFIEANQHHLMTEMAMGKGQHLQALSELLGCETSSFSASMKGHYNEIFVKDDLTGVQLLNLIEAQVFTQDNLRKGCGLI